MQAFSTIFINLLAICGMICIGCLARKKGILTAESTLSLSRLSTSLIYPAAIYSSIVGNFTFSGIMGHKALPLGTLLILGTGFVVGGIVRCFLRNCSQAEKRMFHFQSTVNNYIFLPLPLVMLKYGDAGVGLLSLTTVGSELAVWTIGMVAIFGGFSLRSLKNLLNMPMLAVFLSLATLLARQYMPWQPAEGSLLNECFRAFLATARQFGAGTVAIAMIVAGSRMMELDSTRIFTRLQALLVPMRLVIIPAICIALLKILPFAEDDRKILSIIAVMPTSIASVAFSDVFKADTNTAAASVLLTHAFGILTIAIWMTLIA